MSAFNKVRAICADPESERYLHVVTGEASFDRARVYDGDVFYAVDPGSVCNNTSFFSREGIEIFEGDYINVDDYNGDGAKSALVYFDHESGSFMTMYTTARTYETEIDGNQTTSYYEYVNVTVRTPLDSNRAARSTVVGNIFKEIAIADPEPEPDVATDDDTEDDTDDTPPDPNDDIATVFSDEPADSLSPEEIIATFGDETVEIVSGVSGDKPDDGD